MLFFQLLTASHFLLLLVPLVLVTASPRDLIIDQAGALLTLPTSTNNDDEVFGEEHPHTAMSYENIGNMKEATGDNVGALEMHNKAVTIREKVLGKKHLILLHLTAILGV